MVPWERARTCGSKIHTPACTPFNYSVLRSLQKMHTTTHHYSQKFPERRGGQPSMFLRPAFMEYRSATQLEGQLDSSGRLEVFRTKGYFTPGAFSEDLLCYPSKAFEISASNTALWAPTERLLSSFLSLEALVIDACGYRPTLFALLPVHASSSL